ncbi:MAG: hypothetical protein U1F67_20420 [Rubrivivax sp.]
MLPDHQHRATRASLAFPFYGSGGEEGRYLLTFAIARDGLRLPRLGTTGRRLAALAADLTMSKTFLGYLYWRGSYSSR